jgi:hypothetical protein
MAPAALSRLEGGRNAVAPRTAIQEYCVAVLGDDLGADSTTELVMAQAHELLHLPLVRPLVERKPLVISERVRFLLVGGSTAPCA